MDNYSPPDVKPDLNKVIGNLMVYDILGTCYQRIGINSDGGYVVAEEGLD